MPQQYRTQEELYEAQRKARDQKAKPGTTFQSAPISELVRASEALNRSRMPVLASRQLVPAKGILAPGSVPPSLAALLGLE